MQKPLLMITKNPEFDERGEVVLGQCEPFTPGWRLVLVGEDRSHEELLVGTYTDLRKIQESCATLKKADTIRKRVQEMRALLNSSVTETVAVEFGNSDSAKISTPLLEPTQTSLIPAVPEGVEKTTKVKKKEDDETKVSGDHDDFFEISEESGLRVALVIDPDRVSEPGELTQHLKRLTEGKPKAIVLDLSRIQNLASRAVNELVFFRDTCAEEQIAFGLCRLRKSVRKLLDQLQPENPPAVFADPEAARAELLKK